MRQHLSQVAHVEQRSADRAIAEMIGLGFGNAVGVDGLDGRLLSSLIPRQLPASPMLVLPRRVEHTFNAAVQALMTPIRANIVGPPNSATSIRPSIAACHSGVG
jgi:hypothetical protein